MLTAMILFFSLPLLANADCRLLNLDWGSYDGVIDSSGVLCKYENVRFAAPPIGNLRFRAPAPPDPSDPQAPKGSLSCIQVDMKDSCTPSNGDAVGGKDCTPPLVGTFTEDCLFLDIYVPLTATKSKDPLPVVVWIFGGAFVFGSKGAFDLKKFPLYSGKGPIVAAKGHIIFVVGNYRVGAYGWLAGSTMEADGQPNAGLYDQRMVLNFTKTHIAKLNGDPNKISAWGESAGAGSILHHLISANGTQDPLFSKAVLQSPAYEWQWDRTGTLEQTYQKFARLAGCDDCSLDCLRNASSEKLVSANQRLFHDDTLCNGVFPLGPSMDRDLIHTLPSVAFATNRYWTGLESLLVSHVHEEVAYNSSFVPLPVRQYNNATGFDSFLEAFLPGGALASIRANISAHFPVSNYNDEINRTGIIIQQSLFVCNTRQLFDAYSRIKKPKPIPVYMMHYRFLEDFKGYHLAVHGSDLLPTFYESKMDLADLLCNWNLKEIVSGIIKLYIDPYSRAYNSYMTSHAISGDPNTARTGGAAEVDWPAATTDVDGEYVQSVLEPYTPKNWEFPDNPYFRLSRVDALNTKTICGYWEEIVQEIIDIYTAAPAMSRLTVQDREVAQEM